MSMQIIPPDPNRPSASVVIPPEKKGPKKWAWTPERREFCRLYVQTHNAIESYVRAHHATYCEVDGPAYKTLSMRASRLLRHPAIQAEIRLREGPFLRNFPLTPDGVLREAAACAFSNMGDYFDFTGGRIRVKKANRIPRVAQGAIERMKVKTETRRVKVGTDEQGKAVYEQRQVQTVDLKLHSKPKHLELLCRVFGVGTPRDVMRELLETLPADLRVTVCSILMAKLEADEDRTGKVSSVPTELLGPPPIE